MGLLDVFKKRSNEQAVVVTETGTDENTDIVARSEAMLAEVEVDISALDPVKLPVEQIALLGAGVAEVLPTLRTITQTVSVDGGDKLFRWVNGQNAAGTLKLNRKDNLLGGAFIDNTGKSVFAKFEAVGKQTVTTTAVMPVDAVTLIVAAVLASIEKKLDDIIEIEKQILSFLEEDKESEIEADLRTLTGIIKEYKFNWDNAEYKANHHKLALDIKRTAEKNMIFYQKQVADVMKKNPVLHLQNSVDSKQVSLQKLFRYYRMSLYIYAFASYLEVMLLGNYQTEYIMQVKTQVEEHAQAYKNIHSECYERLEKYSSGSMDKYLVKGVGTAAKAVGDLIGKVPLIKDGSVDEWLVDKGSNLKKHSEDIGKDTLEKFKKIREPGCDMFVENLVLVDRLYNSATDIYIDKENLYLV